MKMVANKRMCAVTPVRYMQPYIYIYIYIYIYGLILTADTKRKSAEKLQIRVRSYSHFI